MSGAEALNGLEAILFSPWLGAASLAASAQALLVGIANMRRYRPAPALAEIADVIDRAVRGRVHLDHVNRGPGRNGVTGLAGTAGRQRRPAVFTIERGGEDLRHRGLAGPA